jgi:SAM-dependent methyltransferase
LHVPGPIFSGFQRTPFMLRFIVAALAITSLPASAALVVASLHATSAQSPSRSLAPYVPTPHDVVERMLRLAKVGPSDVVYDLGCGDGRIVIAAAQKFGARGVGIDIDARLINQAEADAKAAGVSGRARFRVDDALAADISDATVVTLYLLSASNVKLRPILTSKLRRGSRIVSHSFAMGDWEPEVVDTFRDDTGVSRTLYLWTTDGKVRP